MSNTVRDSIAVKLPFKGHEMSELQNDEYVEELDSDNVEVAEIEESADLATDNDGEHDEKPDDGEQKQVNQDAVNDAINKQHRKYQEEKRRADEAERRLAEMQPKPQAPPIVDAPNPFDDDYDTKQTAYVESIRQQAVFENNQQLSQQLTQNQQEATQREQQASENKEIQTYVDNAKAMNISIEQLEQAGQVIGSYNISKDVQMFIVNDKQGPLITQHLATNHTDAEAIANMPPLQAAMYIERTIKPKVAALRPKTTNTPSPATRVSGGGGDKDAGKYRFSKGAQFN